LLVLQNIWSIHFDIHIVTAVHNVHLISIQVNLHIIGIVPVACENFVLANQIRCLAMLFDLNFGGPDERRKIASVVDMRIGERTRSVRGRERRMAIYWKNSV
jgi:THO complex subunit 5